MSPADPHLDHVLMRLLLRCGLGDRHALEKIYDRVSPLFFTYFTRIIDDGVQAEAVTTGFFCTVWRTAGTYDPDTSATAWLMVACLRQARDHRHRS